MNQHPREEAEINTKEFDLLDILNIIWASKKLITLVSSLSLLIFAIYAYSLNDIYTSSALLAPSKQSSAVDNSLRSYGGIASLAGISLPPSSSDDIEALETLSSFKFFKNSVLPNIFLPNLMAVDSWDMKTNTLEYNKNSFNIETGDWVRKASFPKKKKPSAQESYKEFMEERFSISKDLETGFVTLSIHHESPYIAQKWLQDITRAINYTLRQEEKERVSKSINFLDEKISQTNNPLIVESISTLMQTEMEKFMLIESNEDYVFKVIDPPFASEIKSKPSRLLISLSGLFIGFLLSIFYSIIRHFRNK